MEEAGKKTHSQKLNGATKEITIDKPNIFSWHINITVIDLSGRNIDSLDDKVQLPENLLELNLSHNKLVEVPTVVTNLQKLKNLYISHNSVEFFDETPNFCHTLERLDLSTNNLLGPPYWIWTEQPKRLSWINLSCNTKITNSFVHGYLEELLQHQTLVSEVDLNNCGFINKNTELLATFTKAKTIHFGNADYSYHGSNVISEVPSKGLEKCCDIEILNLSNTHIYTINPSIDMLKNLSELNLACNNIGEIPNEFCSLANLETCVLSSNIILYLPDDMHKLKKLVRLYLDSNKLCMLPERLIELPNLKVLDLYDNHLTEVLEGYSHLEEFDVAQNYLDEPLDVDYLEKKEKKHEVVHPETEYSSTEKPPKPDKADSERSSSPEDWDSDTHWIPHDIKYSTPPQNWINFIKRKMKEGNFCPVDAHVVSISEQVMYDKKLNPRVDVECVGQFDDYSSDDS
ncbi:Uncharacterized protein OBRU01_15348 [Operophtera brumata]|uniref:Uncharacterized protein n=1 Tax=Operophtera brumata TaxID=104452 RepID=A0A0L7L2P8_OPEBR|nr:Uncharacterized protein OBRU01_15348 [Operophtera brumata]